MDKIVDNSEFAIHNRNEIVLILDSMLKQHTGLHMEADGRVGLMSAVVALSADNNYVYFDISSDDEINDKILASKTIKFVTNSGVKIRWRGANLRFVELEDGNAFEMPLPAVIERIQRREYFRLQTSHVANALLCTISNSVESVETTIVDISVGGIGVLLRGKLPAFITRGMSFEGCSINFPEVGQVKVTLKVCSIFPAAKAKNGDPMHHIGLEFVKLSPVLSNTIQRVMARLQRVQINIEPDE